MLIQVNYSNNLFGYVKDSMLHGLIESGDIVRFRRSTGWVTVGVDSLRQAKRNIEPKLHDRVNKMVRVVYNDNSYDYVLDNRLDDLIKSNTIAKFERQSGWVTIGIDPVRQSKRTHFKRHPNDVMNRALT